MTDVTNTYGTGYGCACVSRDARTCSRLRYGYYYEEDHSEDHGEYCECLCHEWDDDLDDDIGAGA